MAAITKNRNFFKWLKLLYFKPESTQFWKGAIQGSFHKTLVAIGPVVSEKIFM
jgi:hypothetical protein